MKVYVVMSNNPQQVKEQEVEFVTASESEADEYVSEMDDCCTQGRGYWVDVYEVSSNDY